MVRKFSIPVILAWLAIGVLVSVGVPSLERGPGDGVCGSGLPRRAALARGGDGRHHRQELGAALKTGIIRAMGGTGKVVTAAGLVFCGHHGVYGGLVVRSFMMPSIAALLGRWSGWPLNVRSRPARGKAETVDVGLAVAAMNGHASNGRHAMLGAAPVN